MKYPGELWRYQSRCLLVFFLSLHVIVHSQTPATKAAPDAAQLATIVREISTKQLNPDRWSVIMDAGFNLISVSRYAEAAKLFNAMLAVAPRDQQALYGGSLALFNLRELAGAEDLAQRAIVSARDAAAAAPGTHADNWRGRQSDSLVLLAVVLAVKGDNAGAVVAARNAVELAPKSFDAQLSLGRALYGAGDLSNAIDSFRKAITIRPENPEVRFFLATALESMGDYARAREAYTELIRLQPVRAEGHLGLGVLLLKEDPTRPEQGIRALLRALDLNPDLYEARINLGRALIKAGRSAEAIKHLQHAAMLAPRNPEPHYQLAIAYRKLGQTDNAKRAAAKVKAINSSRRGNGDSAVSNPERQN